MQRSHDPLADTVPGAGGPAVETDDQAERGLLQPHATESERFFEDLKVFVADTGALLQQARTLSGEGALAARVEFDRRLDQAREGIYTVQARAVDRFHDWRDHTERYVREDPWKAVGIAAGIGFLVGILSRRGR